MRISCEEYCERFGYSFPITLEVEQEVFRELDTTAFSQFGGHVDVGATYATLHRGEYVWGLWRERVTDPTILDLWQRLDRKRLAESNDDRASLVRLLGYVIMVVYEIPSRYVVAVLSQSSYPVRIEGVIDRAFDLSQGTV